MKKSKAEWWERGFLKMLDRLTVGKIMLFDDANIIKSFIRKVVEKEKSKQCTRTHDYGYGNGYVPHDAEGNIVKNLRCIYCGKKL